MMRTTSKVDLINILCTQWKEISLFFAEWWGGGITTRHLVKMSVMISLDWSRGKENWKIKSKKLHYQSVGWENYHDLCTNLVLMYVLRNFRLAHLFFFINKISHGSYFSNQKLESWWRTFGDEGFWKLIKIFITGGSHHRLFFVLICITSCMIPPSHSDCPDQCVCIWKSGKETTECINR